MAWWTLGLTPLFEAVKTLGGKYLERKKIEAQGKVDIAQAKVEGQIKRQQTVAEGEVQYDVTAAEGMNYSWKDEFWTLVLGAVFIGCFIPGLQEHIKDGFTFLKGNTPWWFEYAFLGSIAASFGLKSWNMWKGGK